MKKDEHFFHQCVKVLFDLERPSIDEYWNISGVSVLPENVIFTFFRTCRFYSEAFNTGTQKWSSIVQYSCTSIWDLKFTFFLWFLQTVFKWWRFKEITVYHQHTVGVRDHALLCSGLCVKYGKVYNKCTMPQLKTSIWNNEILENDEIFGRHLFPGGVG